MLVAVLFWGQGSSAALRDICELLEHSGRAYHKHVTDVSGGLYTHTAVITPSRTVTMGAVCQLRQKVRPDLLPGAQGLVQSPPTDAGLGRMACLGQQAVAKREASRGLLKACTLRLFPGSTPSGSQRHAVKLGLDN